MDREDFEAALAEALASGCCPRCGARFSHKEVYLSRHALEMGVQCAGQGKVWRLAIPWCPRCECEPDTYGCIHEKMFGNSEEFSRSPLRCDFCMRPGAHVAARIVAKNFIKAELPDGRDFVDAGEWAACADCHRLIQERKFAALVEVGLQGTLAMHPDIPRTPANLATIRGKCRAVYAGVFGFDIDFHDASEA
jgi:hypothetical protein